MAVDDNASGENSVEIEESSETSEKAVESPTPEVEEGKDSNEDTSSPELKAAPAKAKKSESKSDKTSDDSSSESEEEELETEVFPEDESLEEAYDFESGELIDDDPHAGIPSKNNVKSVREFFNTEFLYRFDILEDHERANLKGSYKLEIQGDKKAEWFVDLNDDPTVKSSQNKNETDADLSDIKPEVTISMKERDFILIVNGELNPQLAFLSEKVKVKGSLEKALAFQVIIAPGFE